MSERAREGQRNLELGGIDWAMVAGYFAVVLFIWHGITSQSDFIVAKLIPYGVMGVVTGIFIDYFCRVFRFMARQKNGGDRT
jgi:hypothetical protein